MVRLIRLVVFIIMIPIFAYSFFATSWTGSYIILEEDWKNHIVLTPKTANEPQQIYEIDKFLYAFKYLPVMSVICILSFLILIGIIIYWMIKKFRHYKTITA